MSCSAELLLQQYGEAPWGGRVELDDILALLVHIGDSPEPSESSGAVPVVVVQAAGEAEVGDLGAEVGDG